MLAHSANSNAPANWYDSPGSSTALATLIVAILTYVQMQ